MKISFLLLIILAGVLASCAPYFFAAELAR